MPDTIADLAPKDPLMAIAWADCLRWAITEPEIFNQFVEISGGKWKPPRNGLEAMIDKATGMEAAVTREFVEWFNKNIWEGEPDE